jgi:hypothetical protein
MKTMRQGMQEMQTKAMLPGTRILETTVMPVTDALTPRYQNPAQIPAETSSRTPG